MTVIWILLFNYCLLFMSDTPLSFSPPFPSRHFCTSMGAAAIFVCKIVFEGGRGGVCRLMFAAGGPVRVTRLPAGRLRLGGRQAGTSERDV